MVLDLVSEVDEDTVTCFQTLPFYQIVFSSSIHHNVVCFLLNVNCKETQKRTLRIASSSDKNDGIMVEDFEDRGHRLFYFNEFF